MDIHKNGMLSEEAEETEISRENAEEKEEPYGPATIRFLLSLNSNEVYSSLSDAERNMLLTDDGQTQPGKAYYVMPILEGAKSYREKSKAALAKVLGISESTLSKIKSDDFPSNHLGRNSIFCALLDHTEIWSVQKVRHDGLLRNFQEDLCRNTHSFMKNIRNALIMEVFDYASEGNACPCDNWIAFSSTVFKLVERELRQKHTNIVPIPVLNGKYKEFSADEAFLKGEKKLPDRFYRCVEGISFCDFKWFRRKMVERYKEKYGHVKDDSVFHKIGLGINDSRITPTYLRGMFGSGVRCKPGSRKAVIDVAIRLECSLDETNRMLAECNMPLIYPRNREKEDYRAAYFLLNNEKNRDKTLAPLK